MIRLMIADDHAIMREGLKQLFSLTTDIQVVAEATNGAETLSRLRDTDLDILLLDMTMPGLNGEELVGRIRGHYPDLPILVLSMHSETQIAQRSLRAGANGYLTKDRDPEMLLDAIRKVAAGGRFLDPQIAQQLAFASSGVAPAADHECLSDREFQVLRLFARGLGINEIAVELSISNKTVSTHKARLMEKMSFASNADLIRYAVTHKLI